MGTIWEPFFWSLLNVSNTSISFTYKNSLLFNVMLCKITVVCALFSSNSKGGSLEQTKGGSLEQNSELD